MNDLIAKRLQEAFNGGEEFKFSINLQKEEETFENCAYTVEPVETWFRPGFARFRIADNLAIRFENIDDENIVSYIEKIGVGMSPVLDTRKVERELSSKELLMFTSSILQVCGKKEYKHKLAEVADNLQPILRAQINCSDKFSIEGFK